MAENINDEIFKSYDDYLDRLMSDDDYDIFGKDETSNEEDLVIKPVKEEKNILPIQARADLFAAMPEAVAGSAYIGGYYQEKDEKGDYLAVEIKSSGSEIKDYGDHLEVSKNPSPEDILFMVADAKNHNWSPIEVEGDDEFMASVWLECQRQGVVLDNYKPSKDLQNQWIDEQDARHVCEEKAKKKSKDTDVTDGKALAGFMSKGIKKHASGGKGSEIPSDKRPLGRFLDRVAKLEDKPAVKIGLTLGAAMVGPYAVMGYGMFRTYKDFRKELNENKAKKQERAEQIMEFMKKGVSYDKLPADLKKEDKWGGVRPWLKLAARTTIYASSFAAGVTVCSLPVRTVLAGGYGAAMLLQKTKALSWVRDKITGKKKEVDENKPKLSLKEKLKANKKQLVEAGVQTAGIFAASIVGGQIHHNWDDISQTVTDIAHNASDKFNDFSNSVSNTSGKFMDRVSNFFEKDVKVAGVAENVQTEQKSSGFFSKITNMFSKNDEKVSVNSENVTTGNQSHNATGALKDKVTNIASKDYDGDGSAKVEEILNTSKTYEYPKEYKGKLFISEAIKGRAGTDTNHLGSDSFKGASLHRTGEFMGGKESFYMDKTYKVDINDGDALGTLKVLRPDVYEKICQQNGGKDLLSIANQKDAYGLYEAAKTDPQYAGVSDDVLQEKAIKTVMNSRIENIKDNVAKFRTDDMINDNPNLTQEDAAKIYQEQRSAIEAKSTSNTTTHVAGEKANETLETKSVTENRSVLIDNEKNTENATVNRNQSLINEDERNRVAQEKYSQSLHTDNNVTVSYPEKYEGISISQQNGQFNYEVNAKDDVGLATLKAMNPEEYNQQFVKGGVDPLDEMAKKEAVEKFKTYKNMSEYSGMSREQIKQAAWNDVMTERQEGVNNNLAKFYTDKWVAEHPTENVSKSELYEVAHKEVEAAYAPKGGEVVANNATNGKTSVREMLDKVSDKSSDAAEAAAGSREIMGSVESVGKTLGKDINLDKAQDAGIDVIRQGRGLSESTKFAGRAMDAREQMRQDIAQMKQDGVTAEGVRKVLVDQSSMINCAERTVSGLGDVIGDDKVSGISDKISDAQKISKDVIYSNSQFGKVLNLFKKSR